jgi:hypothetical protein
VIYVPRSHKREVAMASTITVPEGFFAVVVFVPKSETGEAKLEFLGHEEGMEAAIAADAIPVLVDFMSDEIESLNDELAEAAGGDAEGTDEPEKPS